jgi:phosphatidylglycerophosphatase A
LPVGGSVPRRLLGTVAGIGWLPLAPGTWASLVTALALGFVLGVEGHAPGILPDGLTTTEVVIGLGVVAAVLFVLGIWVGASATQDYGKGDPGAFVLDEVVGQMLPVMAVFVMAQGAEASDGLAPLPLFGLGLAFAAFRLFDIVKPPPIRQVERLHGGLGIMADDVVAGLFAGLVVVAAGVLAG